MKQRHNKFNAKKINGFDSKLEFSVFLFLSSKEKKGELKNIIKQDTVFLTRAKISWRVDFSAEKPCGEKIYIEAKGIETIDYKLKKKLWEIYGPGELYIYKGTYESLRLAEVIDPKNPKIKTKVVKNRLKKEVF